MEESPLQAPSSDAWAEQIVASLHAERDGVREFLATQHARLERAETTLEDAIARLEAAVSDGTADSGDDAGGSAREDEYRRRYEMALDDLRELKAANSLLQEQLSKARATASTLAKQYQSQQTSVDWETEKLRILAALESDLDENNSEQRAERVKIEDVLQSTERAIAEKDAEIQELKQRLEQAGNSSLDQMAAAVEQMLQNDVVIQQEREKLRQMEEELQSRLCRAEIEISLERAKLARERSEMEERLRLAGFDAAKPAGEQNAAAEKPTRGRWLSRLGLTEADRERGRRR